MKDIRHGLDLDTSPEAARIQIELIRRKSTEERAELLTGICQMVDTFAAAGIRHRFPNASDREVFLRLAVLRLGGDLARRAYPEVGSHLDAP
ncbi:MAG TPA: hypothetical protein VF139_12025 [Candidatus Polarisedimenticolaceae bacterium]